MKKGIIVLGVVFFDLLSGVFATNVPDAFQIEVNPSTFSVNQSVDVTIKALKNKKVMQNATEDFFVSVVGKVNGEEIAIRDYVIFSNGRGKFDLTDQGVKTFSKGLSILKPGTFTIEVENMSSSASGSTTVIVTADKTVETKEISILSPVAGVEETTSSINVMANAPDLPNATMQIFLNDVQIKEGMSDSAGLLTETIEGLKAGTNYVQIKAISLAGDLVGQSEKTVFTYKAQTEDLLKGVTATPNQSVKLGDKVRFEIYTDDAVSSAKLLFANGKGYPLVKEKDGLFAAQAMMESTGEVQISASLSAGALTTKKYENILALQVDENTQIGAVKIQTHPELAGAVQLSWDVEGKKSDRYGIKYGLTRDDLVGLVVTTGQAATLSGFTYGKEYFFQIFATDVSQVPQGLPSDVIEFKMPVNTGTGVFPEALTGGVIDKDHPAPALPTCVLKNIKVTTEKIGNKYYLVRKPGENVSKYLVYKSDYEDGANKTFLGETQLPRFEYPFDKTSEEAVYAYYTVEAICTDGASVMIADAKKVQVGPLEDMLLIFTSTALLYLLYRLYNYAV